jgi:hypothetical protein
VIGGLAVGAIGEARTTGDVDVVAFASPLDAEALFAKAVAAGDLSAAGLDLDQAVRIWDDGPPSFQERP